MGVGVLLAYGLCFLSAFLCIGYGIINWNKGSHELTEEDKNWALEEKNRKNF